MTTQAQPQLFALESASGELELFPAVWQAAEKLSSPDVSQRTAAVEELAELNAPRLSPLVAHVLITLLSDPHLPLRATVVEIIGDVLEADNEGRPAPEEVRKTLRHWLSQMRTRPIFAILQVSVAHPHLWGHVARLLNDCPYAGVQLADILADRRHDVAVRQQAAHHIGEVGFMDALPVLKRLESRLETRLGGQRQMPFAPPSAVDETALLPSIKTALKMLS
ncbi:MAG: hypothetical protein DWQ07_00335 [Chloroflexi bacterium]|nr:MAG: hypothetical protein DWQ07_00335 [Chloroflexota bacterium]MBL1195781.1 hypothetical protein [Chloroflexota bacterium]NOH13072.1 hypothetical protein [Chloroflexota bacterium]